MSHSCGIHVKAGDYFSRPCYSSDPFWLLEPVLSGFPASLWTQEVTPSPRVPFRTLGIFSMSAKNSLIGRGGEVAQRDWDPYLIELENIHWENALLDGVLAERAVNHRFKERKLLDTPINSVSVHEGIPPAAPSLCSASRRSAGSLPHWQNTMIIAAGSNRM